MQGELAELLDLILARLEKTARGHHGRKDLGVCWGLEVPVLNVTAQVRTQKSVGAVRATALVLEGDVSSGTEGAVAPVVDLAELAALGPPGRLGT